MISYVLAIAQAVQIRLRQRALEKSASDVGFMISILGSEAGALGAVKLASEKVLESL